MEKLKALLNSRRPLSIEAPPVKSREDIDNVIKLYREFNLEKYFKIMNIPSNPLGRPSSDPGIPAYILMRELGVSPIIHIPYGSDTSYSFIGRLIEYSIGGIEGILLLSGDVRIGDITLEEAIRYVKMIEEGELILDGRKVKLKPWRFVVGGALIQYRENELEKVLYKRKVGIEFFQTQITVDRQPLYDLCSKISNILDGDITILVGFAPSILRTPKVLSEILGGRGREISSMDIKTYIEYIVDIASSFLDGFKDTEINIGIHVFPMKWDSESMDLVSEFISRF